MPPQRRRRRRRSRPQIGARVPAYLARPPRAFDPTQHGNLLTLVSVGALVTLGRMAQHHREGKGEFDTIEGVITGMILYGVLDSVRSISRDGHGGR